jgi:hypothetical protein
MTRVTRRGTFAQHAATRGLQAMVDVVRQTMTRNIAVRREIP